MARRRVVATVLVALAIGLAAAACTGDEEPVAAPTTVAPPTLPAASSLPSSSPPATEPAATPTSTSSPSEGVRTLVYHLVREAPDGVWVEPVTFHPGDVGQAVARAAFTELLGAPDRDGLVNLVPEGTELRDVAVADGVLTVDLSGDVAQNPGAGGAAEVAFQQVIAHTGAQFPTVDSVQVLVEGQAVTDLWGHADWSEPLVPDPFAISPIVVTEAVGSSGQIALSGSAITFEATIDIAVVDAAGNLVTESFATASCGTGCRGDWTATIDDLAPGTYDVTLREPDPSGGEATVPPFEVTVQVTVPS